MNKGGKIVMLNIIGRCTINKDKIEKTMPQVIYDEFNNETRKYWRHIHPLQQSKDKEFNEFIRKAYDNTFENVGYYSEKKLELYTNNFVEKFNKWYNDITEADFAIKCVFVDEMIAIITVSSISDSAWIFPSDLVTVNKYKDYEKLSGIQRAALLGNSTTNNINTSIVGVEDYSKSDVLENKINLNNKKENIEKEIEDIKEAKTDELAKLQAEIDEKIKALEDKKQSMINVLAARKKEMEEQLEQLEMTVFRLDAEIYSIRCYTGEIVELKKLRNGKPASDKTPLVFYQKMRYLDEELGKYTSIYNADFRNVNHFETLLKQRNDIMEVFAPSERSLMLVKISRTGISYKQDERNLLEAYKKYHGQKVAIILRDGDNLYIAWTDDDKINFSNDAFYKTEETEVTEEEKTRFEQGKYERDDEYKKRIKKIQKNNIEEQLGRYYIFSIMQGIIDREVIKFPEPVKFGNTSPYLVLSYADGWLTTNQYGSFDVLINRSNSFIKKGDNVLTIQSLHPISWYRRYSTYNNDRGRGEKNRTHDVSAEDCTIYPINFVEHFADYKYTFCNSNDKSRWSDNELKKNLNDNRYSNIQKIENTDSYKHFISLEKGWSSCQAHANFEVFDDEIINLTFMNSVWLEYVITNQKTQGIRVGGTLVDFSHLLPYLKTALQFVRKREVEFAKYIAKYNKNLLNDEEWPVKLSEWMLKNDYHNFSEFRAKQFSKENK